MFLLELCNLEPHIQILVDLADSDERAKHIDEAINYRNLDKEGWAG
jgi:hypothetical protein